MGRGVGSLCRDRDELDGPADGPEVRGTIAWPERRAGDGNRTRTTSLEGHVRHGLLLRVGPPCLELPHEPDFRPPRLEAQKERERCSARDRPSGSTASRWIALTQMVYH